MKLATRLANIINDTSLAHFDWPIQQEHRKLAQLQAKDLSACQRRPVLPLVSDNEPVYWQYSTS